MTNERVFYRILETGNKKGHKQRLQIEDIERKSYVITVMVLPENEPSSSSSFDDEISSFSVLGDYRQYQNAVFVVHELLASSSNWLITIVVHKTENHIRNVLFKLLCSYSARWCLNPSVDGRD